MLVLLLQVYVRQHDQGTSAAAQPGADGMTIRLSHDICVQEETSSHDICNAVNASYVASEVEGAPE